ncbi:MAG: hypothetical protein GY820_16040, partial [Gammaproteobacteria bacterium]|nr:hypothetical protein [Gammaproteobacteria bacterium]
MKTQYGPALDPLQPRGRMRDTILFIKDKPRQVRNRIDRITDPYRNYHHHFLDLMAQMGGNIMDTLEPYIMDMEVTMVIDCFLSLKGLSTPTSVFDNWIWNHSGFRRGCETHMNLIRNLFQQQTARHRNSWTYALVQQAMHHFLEFFVEIRIAQLYEDLYTLCYQMTKAHIWKAVEQRALYIRKQMDTKMPPFRYFGKPDKLHYDPEIKRRSVLEVLRSCLQMGFCMKSALGEQNRGEFNEIKKNGRIPLLVSYGATMPPVPVGMTREQHEERWFAELKKTRPEWYQGDHEEDANYEWSARYGAKLAHEQQYQDIVHEGPEKGETAEEFGEKMKRCFVIMGRGEEEELRKQFYRENMD